ncbi:MAG: thioredoxin domain-containing protein [Candidatus Lokiarchaeota archaeon]|nr:thioredoxin domain-containing protein [Candidatus Lokiarchaeota archaeon]
MNTNLEATVKNHLQNEKSPYLTQHANNPVDWYPWGEEAFDKAKKEDKPIFLSIGYSTCHWCHVMAHESFEDDEVAELMNKTFISIKVDREERPDIDKIYMTVCQMMTSSGGWPLTIIMTPDKKPFFAGTYFPKKSRFGRVGLIDLINRIKISWDTQRNDLLSSANQVTFNLKNIDQESPGEKFNEYSLKRAYEMLTKQYDKINGGFGNRPKFPTPHNLIFLLRYWKRTGDIKALDMVENTLQAMRKGGIYDHIGFGFHRYSTDASWLVPHFEKMLYDQALIAIAYIETYQATKNKEYKQTAQEIFTYVMRDMISSEGGFYSAEDADSEGEEGKFYVWSHQELEDILDDEDYNLVKKIFNVDELGNYLEEATGKKTGKNILHLKKEPTKEAQDNIEKIRLKIFHEREIRIHPHKDDKILTDWNGLMIAALAKGAIAFQDEEYLNIARKSADFILSNLYSTDRNLLHRYKDGISEINGYLTDYSFLIWGLIELYEATFEISYLKSAIELHQKQIDKFWDDNTGGFYFTATDSEELLIRQKEIYDGAIPSGNSIATLNLLRLSYLTGNHELEEKADLLNRVFSERIKSNPLAYTQFLVAIDFAIGPTYSLVIGGNTDAEDTRSMIKAVNNIYTPNKVFILRKTEEETPDIDNFSNFVQFFENLEGKATAYVCINKTCKPPTQEIEKIIQYLKADWN